MVLERFKSALDYPAKSYDDRIFSETGSDEAKEFISQMERPSISVYFYTGAGSTVDVDYLKELESSRSQETVYETEIRKYDNPTVRLDAELPRADPDADLPDSDPGLRTRLIEPVEVQVRGRSPYSWEETVDRLG